MAKEQEQIQQLSIQVALLGQAVNLTQEQLKENTAGIRENRDDILVIKTKWAMVAVLGGVAGSVTGGLILWGLKAKLGF